MMYAHATIMADAAKREKIAAAKKKLKQFQQKKTPTPNAASNGKTSRREKAVSDAPSKLNGPTLPDVTNGSANSSHSSTPRSGTPTQAVVYSPVQNTHPSPNTSNNMRPTASTEQLHQLSRQINGLISQSNSYINNDDSADVSSVTALEERNRELASLLEQHTKVNEALNKQLQEMKQQNVKLQGSLDMDRKTFEDKMKRELGALKEQLQVHIQTIGILVAEKTELQSSLNQAQKQADQRVEEIEELSGRLKASRQRVADLEKSFTTASTSSQKLESSSKVLNKEVDRLKLELYKLNKSNEDFQQQVSELQGKLQTKTKQCATLEDNVIELKGKYEMSQLNLQQLQNSQDTADSTQQVDQLVTEKSELQTKLDQYEEAFQQLQAERDQITTQYQQYIEQINTHSAQLQEQVNGLLDERGRLTERQAELEGTVQELMKHKANIEVESSEAVSATSELRDTCSRLNNELEELRQKYQTQVTDNSHLSRLVAEKEDKLAELELNVQRLSDSSVDKEKILTDMQSDKTALSRAMAQNKELKHQLAELQNGFVKMSNENMDYMTQLTSEQHIAKELAARLSQQEEELKEIREQLSQKEAKLRELAEESSHHVHLQSYTTEQIEDRIRHYEAQGQLVETLQRELNSAQDTINALTNQNTILQAQLTTQRDQVDNGYSSDEENTANNKEHVATTGRLASLNASIHQLESERNQVLQELQDERDVSREYQDKLKQLQHELANQTPATLNGDVISKPQFEALQHAMQQLEGKYTKAMRDKADLTDKSEQLEHLIMQLQGETETIGEYVALYQQQRSLLRERQLEKDDYISRLSRERGDLLDKLGQLQQLVMQLLQERQVLHGHHGNHHDNHEQQHALSNHITPTSSLSEAAQKTEEKFGATLDSSNLEDWPDYTSSDSDTSEVEAIVGGKSGETTSTPGKTHATPPQAAIPSHPSHTSAMSPHSPGRHKLNIPHEDHTAQQIMNLLTELGSSHYLEGAPASFDSRHFIHCNHCTGKLLIV